MLDDKDRGVRGCAAATLARLSETHAGRLVRILERLKEGLGDDSAYVRWCLAYALGRMGAAIPAHSQRFLSELVERLEDENKVVRIIACRALGRIARRRPQQVKEAFTGGKRDIPAPIERLVRG
jgi:HEAT repeat protein